MPRSKANNGLITKWGFIQKDVLTEQCKNKIKFKPRLVTRGFEHILAFDYNGTFVPVIKFTMLRLFHAVVVVNDLQSYQMDVRKAFLNGNRKEEFLWNSHKDLLARNTLTVSVN